jgi:hypothetical protein
MTKRDVEVQHELEGSVIKWVIYDKTHNAPTSCIVVIIDLSLPEDYMEAVFAIANDLSPILMDAAQAFRSKVMGN